MSADPPSVLLSALSLYLGTGVCLLALMLTRQAYKLSPGFRTRLAATGFGQLAMDAPASEKATVMLAVLRDAWPATVSEMLQDTEAAHGMVFRSLMVAGCLAGMQCDFATLTPSPPSDLTLAMTSVIAVVHLLRKLVLAAAVGFCFAPATGRDHGVDALREAYTSAADGADAVSTRLRRVPWLRELRMKELSAAKRAEIARTSIVGTIHTMLAGGMLSLLPALELVALAWEAWLAAPQHAVRIGALGADPCSVAWCAVALLRGMHVAAINLCMSVFIFHFTLGFFSPSRHHAFKGFWAEYSACRLFAQLMQLAAIQAAFAWPLEFGRLPSGVQYAALAVAAAHGVSSFVFCARNALLCLRNVEYSEAELATIFEQWRALEMAVQTLLDAQLAFIARLQNYYATEPPAHPPRRWLMLRQVVLLSRLRAAGDFPMPASPRKKMAHAHAE